MKGRTFPRGSNGRTAPMYGRLWGLLPMVTALRPGQPEGMDEHSRLANMITIITAVVVLVAGAVLIASV